MRCPLLPYTADTSTTANMATTLRLVFNRPVPEFPSSDAACRKIDSSTSTLTGLSLEVRSATTLVVSDNHHNHGRSRDGKGLAPRRSKGGLCVPSRITGGRRASLKPRTGQQPMNWRRKLSLPGFYIKKGTIGFGGQAKIFLARRVRDDRNLFALKFMEQSWGASQKKPVRQLCNQQQHPNIVYQHEFIVNPDFPNQSVSVLEYCEGGDLANMACRALDNNAYPSEHVLLHILCGLAHALAFLHKQPDGSCILHCDVKPDNILLKRDSNARFGFEPKLCDLDLAIFYDKDNELTEPLIHGTPYWHPSHEQGFFSPATDVFSLGVSMYQLATGGDPHVEGSHERIGLTRTDFLLGLKNMGYSREFRMILGYMLHFDPADRAPAAQIASMCAVALLKQDEEDETKDPTQLMPGVFQWNVLDDNAFDGAECGCSCTQWPQECMHKQ